MIAARTEGGSGSDSAARRRPQQDASEAQLPALPADELERSEAQQEQFDRDLQAAIGLGNDPGLELLVDLAKRGEYDPWDVDVVDLTDTYLTALDEVLDARDLGRVARLIFYAACLIHLKAQAMAARQKQLDYEDALEATLAEEFDFELGGERGRFSPRLLPGDQPLDYGFLRGEEDGGFDAASFLSPREQPLRSRGLTLVDLIFALREYDDRLAQRELEASDEPIFDAEMALVECVGSSHQDDLEGDIERIRLELWAAMGRHEPLIGAAQRIELQTLVRPGRSKSATFLALLFLANDEEIVLEQPEIYGELFIERGRHFGEVRAGVAPPEDEDEDDDDPLAEVIPAGDEGDDHEINQPASLEDEEGGEE